MLHRWFRLPIVLSAFLVLAPFSIATPCAASAPTSENSADSPPNLLFLFSDDQRYDTVAALGNQHIKTPNLDRLVDRGFVFRNTYCQGSMSGAVCYPSRAMVNSGRSLWHAPGNLQDVPIWPETLRNRGYATFGTGKWHNGSASYARGFTHGGAIFFGGMSDHWKVPIHDFDPTGTYSRKDRRIGDKFSSELFADAAIEFLENRPQDKPFYMYVAFTAPHDPRTPPGEYRQMYDPEKLPLPKSFLPEHPFDNGEMRIRDEMLAPFPRTPEVVRQHIADYYGMISHMDAQIGRILEKLDESGAAGNTIVIFSSDHGLSVGRHGLLGKQNLYEHAMRPPLVFTGRGIEKGESDALVYLYDLFPTACDLLHVPVPEGVEGKSLAPIIRGEADKVRGWVLGAYKNVQRMVRQPRWKLIKYNVRGVKTRQLFDLENDPWEMNNLVDEPGAQQPLSQLESLLAEAREKFDDPIDFEAAIASEQTSKTAGRPVKADRQGRFVLNPEDAQVVGYALRYQANKGNLGAWTSGKDYAQWKLDDVNPGKYRVTFTYGCGTPGQRCAVGVGEKKLDVTTESTGGIRSYKPHEIGVLELPGGKATLVVKAVDKLRGPLMNFRQIVLEPVGK